MRLWSWKDGGTLVSAVHWGFGVVPHLILYPMGVLKASELVGHGLGQLSP